MLVYWYPISTFGYDRLLTSREMQWMLTAARNRVPSIPVVGVYQAFWGMEDAGVPDEPQSAAQVKEQIADFVREGASGLVAFIYGGKDQKNWSGWDADSAVTSIIGEVNREIMSTGALIIART